MSHRSAPIGRPLSARLAHSTLVDGDNPEAGVDQPGCEEAQLGAEVEHGRGAVFEIFEEIVERYHQYVIFE